MDTALLDANALNNFLASLSKSLQALCHGCMEFNNGIQMIGYININIDSQNSVDCVLNERVKKGSKTNSMTFTSNSFVARKERNVVMMDASCSPKTDPVKRRDEGSHPSFGVKKRRSLDDAAKAMSMRKRHRRGHAHSAPVHDSVRQGHLHSFPLHFQENTLHEQDFNVPEIKQEICEDSQCMDLSSQAVKREISDSAHQIDNSHNEVKVDQTFSGNASANHPIATLTCEHETERSYEPELQRSYKPETQQFVFEFEKSSLKQKASPCNSKYGHDVEHTKDCIVVGSSSSLSQSQSEDSQHTAHKVNTFAERLTFLSKAAVEETSLVDTGKCETIHIRDGAVQVHGLFNLSASVLSPQNVSGQHLVGPGHSGVVWNGTPSLDESACYTNEGRERKNHAARVYRLNMTHEQRERERWLARMRQRRRRAKLRQQIPASSDLGSSLKHEIIP